MCNASPNQPRNLRRASPAAGDRDGLFAFSASQAAIWISLMLVAISNATAAENGPRAGGDPERSRLTASDAKWQQQIRDEAPKAWAELEQFYAQVRGSYTTTSSWEKPPADAARAKRPPWPSHRAEFAANGNLLESAEVDEKGIEHVMAKNEVYAFAVGRRAEDPSARFAIEWLERLGVDAKVDKRVEDEARQWGSFIFGAWKFYGRSLPEWTNTPPFTIKKVSAAGNDKQPLVRVEFERLPIGSEKAREYIDGYVLFDPSDHWVVREFGSKWWDGGSRHTIAEYGQRQGGIPILSKTTEIGAGLQIATRKMIVFDVRHEQVPTDEFRLSHYAIPEPDFAALRSHWSVWLYLNAALVCLVIAMFLWWRKRKVSLAH